MQFNFPRNIFPLEGTLFCKKVKIVVKAARKIFQGQEEPRLSLWSLVSLLLHGDLPVVSPYVPGHVMGMAVIAAF